MPLDAVIEIGPGFDAVAFRRIRAAAADDRADEVLLDIRAVLNKGPVRLSHLADLLVEGHPREERLDLGIERGEGLPLRRGGEHRRTAKHRGAEEGTDVHVSK